MPFDTQVKIVQPSLFEMEERPQIERKVYTPNDDEDLKEFDAEWEKQVGCTESWIAHENNHVVEVRCLAGGYWFYVDGNCYGSSLWEQYSKRVAIREARKDHAT